MLTADSRTQTLCSSWGVQMCIDSNEDSSRVQGVVTFSQPFGIFSESAKRRSRIDGYRCTASRRFARHQDLVRPPLRLQGLGGS